MRKFFQQRVSGHQKKMQRYLKYVVNDHFALTMTFLVGGLGLYYSNSLQALPANFTWGGVIVLLVWLIALHVGQFTTLTQPADKVFLLPKEQQMREYLVKAFQYSCYFPFVVLLLIGGAMMPLLVVSLNQKFSLFIFYLLMLWGLKFSQLEIQRMALFQDMEKATKNAYILWTIVSIAILGLSIFLHPIVGLIMSGLQIYLFHNLCWRRMYAPLDWEKMIAVEEHRLHRLYRFINLFTDVPEITPEIKRRKYFDVILKKITYSFNHTYLYLYVRRFLRGTEYSGLYLRLTAIGSLALFFIGDRWFALTIGALFIYLIGFQMLPLYQQFRYMTATQLYPVPEAQKLVAIKQLLRVILSVTVAVFSLVSLLVLPNWLDRGIVILGFWIILGLFVEVYLPYRIKKTLSN